MRAASGLLPCAGREGYRAPTAPRSFETGTRRLLGALRIAGMRQGNERKRSDKSERRTLRDLAMGRGA